MVDAQKILLVLIGLKGVLTAFGIDVFSTEQAEAIANGAAALCAVAIAVYNVLKKQELQKELASVKGELRQAYKD
jgi:drug/metabolite transporter (DMT)-like permease